MAANIRTGAMYLIDFFDITGVDLGGTEAFTDVEAIQVHLRYSTDTAQVSVAVPSEPVCVVSYVNASMGCCVDVTETIDQPDAEGEWRFNASNDRVSLVPWIGEDTSVLMVFDVDTTDAETPTCPVCFCP